MRLLRGLQETRVVTREESGVLGFPSRRRDTGAWSGAWSPFSLAAALPIASSSISLSWVLGRLLPDPAQVLLHCVVAGELQGKGVCHLSVFLQKRKAELQVPGRAYTHPMNIFAWGSVTLNSKEKTL